MKYEVCNVEELQPGTFRVYYLNNKIPLVVGCSLNNQYFAVRDICPHQGARLSKGKLTWKTKADRPCEYHIEREGEILRCPWHGFDFDTKTGKCLKDPQRMHVKTYCVSVQDNKVILEVNE